MDGDEWVEVTGTKRQKELAYRHQYLDWVARHRPQDVDHEISGCGSHDGQHCHRRDPKLAGAYYYEVGWKLGRWKRADHAARTRGSAA